MANNLDQIVTVSIDISSPIVDSASFDNLLILGAAPKRVAEPDTGVGVYSNLEEVTDAGYVFIGNDADIVGVAARVAFSQSPAPTKIYIAPVGAEEKVADILEAAAAVLGWYVVCPVGLENDDLDAVIAWVEAHEKICSYTELNAQPTREKAFYRSFGIFGKVTPKQDEQSVPAENKCINVAWAAKCLNYHAGEETWAFKTLAGILPSKLTGAEIVVLEECNVSYFLTTAAKNITYCGKVLAGEWVDVIRFRDWQKNDMQVRVANLFVTKPKVPYTDKGIGLVENQMIASLKAGTNYGGIANDEYDDDGNVIPGFKTSVPRSASLTSSQKASRKLVNCTFAARPAGAIHLTEIKGSLTYSM